MSVISLYSIDPVLAASGGEPMSYEVMEAYGPQREASNDKRWLPADTLFPVEFSDSEDLEMLFQAAAQSVASGENHSHRPFARLGWFEDLKQWVEEAVEPRGLCLSGRFRQLNATPTFSLIRFETNGPAVWFKAIGEPNLREYSITLSLATFASRFLPKLVCTRPEWQGWLALEAEGARLADNSEPRAWLTTARDLADLQIDSLGATAQLLEANARDLRIVALKSNVEPFFDHLGRLMEQQSKVPPPVLSREELLHLSTRVSEALDILDQTGFPPALGHLDLNPENIVCSPNNSVFLDWAGGFVGHPLLTFEYHVEFFRKTFGIGHALESQMVECYFAPWRDLISDHSIRRAFESAPLVAVFAYATANQLWNNVETITEPRTASLLRSLARRMSREARLLRERSVPCLV